MDLIEEADSPSHSQCDSLPAPMALFLKFCHKKNQSEDLKSWEKTELWRSEANLWIFNKDRIPPNTFHSLDFCQPVYYQNRSLCLLSIIWHRKNKSCLSALHKNDWSYDSIAFLPTHFKMIYSYDTNLTDSDPLILTFLSKDCFSKALLVHNVPSSLSCLVADSLFFFLF